MVINSKKRTVARPPYQLYMPFADMRNFVAMLPPDKKEGVEADYDTIHASVQGFNIGLRVKERVPYSSITYVDDGAPFKFTVNVWFDADGGNPDSTIFHIAIEADLNFMLKMLLSSKLQDAVDKLVDTVADMSEGKMPEGMPEGFDFSGMGNK